LLKAGIIDEIVPEPIGGAHTDPVAAAASVDEALARSLAEVTALTSNARLEARYEKFRNMGRLGIDFTDGG
jgi:acetyl-CoA carboxylase carboxyl transferase subunit alpha